ncbi:hypothetical protein, partial [Mycobacterium sp. ST-F2]|uniref:hypothetical protein n=1 Tax=Mycobacterium sp. ST-F2 TaxID=1490484 RepID=UPI001C2803C6
RQRRANHLYTLICEEPRIAGAGVIEQLDQAKVAAGPARNESECRHIRDEAETCALSVSAKNNSPLNGRCLSINADCS